MSAASAISGTFASGYLELPIFVAAIINNYNTKFL
jgi:hypothetical protein